MQQKGDVTRDFEALRNVESGPFLLKEDVCDYDLIFHIIDCLDDSEEYFAAWMKVLKYMVETNPDTLFHTLHFRDSSGYYPLSWQVASFGRYDDLDILEYILGIAIHTCPL